MSDDEIAERRRLGEDERREKNWKRWGPYLSERQWGTVREDYSAGGAAWDDLTHDHARSRAYRWGEDGLLGITDRECRLCFAVALWNGKDPILKERLFGLGGPEGNHGEDVKECYYYLDATPTASYLKALYKYPTSAFPYAQLVEGGRRSKEQGELELADTGIFERGHVDVLAEYAKASPDDILIRLTLTNRGKEPTTLHVLPTLWFRNTWSWGRTGEGYWPKGSLRRAGASDADGLVIEHSTLAKMRFVAGPGPNHDLPRFLFTENESNSERLWGVPNKMPYVKDAFHAYVIDGKRDAVSPEHVGTKAAAHYMLTLAAGESASFHLRLFAEEESSLEPLGDEFDQTFTVRKKETDELYAQVIPAEATDDERLVARQAYAGLIWSKQFYHYVVRDWLAGNPSAPPPPADRAHGRNHDWDHLYNRDVISMPDKWEYPWFAAWDLAFQMIPFARIDPLFAKEQLILLLREWYMHPNGQIPAYEYAFRDVNPPVHAWAALRVHKLTGTRGNRDRAFLARVFHKLLLNFTWWVNREDPEGNNLFGGGFLGLDNIGVFDRSQPLPTGGQLEQADATAWIAFFASEMLAIALELAADDPAYEDVASKFLEHYVAIAEAMNKLGGTGLWNHEDGFYYDQIRTNGGQVIPMRVRSLVGVVPLLAVHVLDDDLISRLPGFTRRMHWFLENRKEAAGQLANVVTTSGHRRRLLAIASREQLVRVLRYILDEREFLAPHGVRSLSRFHLEHPYSLYLGSGEYKVGYDPGESRTGLFGGNSNWRGPVWFPLNFLLIEALERYYHFYGDELRVECPTGSGRLMNLHEVASDLCARLISPFVPGPEGRRPCHGDDPRYAADPAWKDLVLFYEYFHGDSGRGLGASHQTGWTALVARCIDMSARQRRATTR